MNTENLINTPYEFEEEQKFNSRLNALSETLETLTNASETNTETDNAQTEAIEKGAQTDIKQDEDIQALKEQFDAIDIPSIEGLASEEFVTEQINASIEGLASEEFVTENTKDSVKWDVRGDRKHVVLDNHNNILGKGTDGGEYNLAMVSKWNVADFGSNAIHMNLNSSDEVTINDTEKVATQAWVNAIINTLIARIEELEKK